MNTNAMKTVHVRRGQWIGCVRCGRWFDADSPADAVTVDAYRCPWCDPKPKTAHRRRLPRWVRVWSAIALAHLLLYALCALTIGATP